MGVKVTIGRITSERGVELLKHNQLSLVDENQDLFETYLSVENSLVSSFISELTLTEQHGTHQCWSLTDPMAFVQEAEKRMPRREVDMDALDVHCVEQVTNHVPYALLRIRRGLEADAKTNRFSHYFVRFA